MIKIVEDMHAKYEYVMRDVIRLETWTNPGNSDTVAKWVLSQI